ncbi:MAG: hypothetical protein JWQ08_2173, partial [Deinococcus sp.]|nr:hypothetical protein [Deinococcus sp.]
MDADPSYVGDAKSGMCRLRLHRSGSDGFI